MIAGQNSLPPVAVVGGGIVGLSIAWRLAQQGWPVEVFDAGRVGSESSWAGAGMLAPGGEIDSESPLASLCLRSRELYRHYVEQLERESETVIDFQEAGALELAYSPAEWAALEAKAVLQERLNIRSRPVDAKQVATFWPRVRMAGLCGARFFANDASVNPREVVSALKLALANRAIQLNEDCPVSQLVMTENHVELTCQTGTRRFDAAVVAMGAWSSKLAVVNVPPLPGSEPVKGHLIGYHQPEQTCSTIIRHSSTYLLQRANGLLIAGASVERIGFDRSLNPARIAELAAQAALVFPHLAETTPTEVWMGFRPGADDLKIGPWHSPRLQLAYGHYRNGILLAPVTAEIIVGELSASLRKS